MVQALDFLPARPAASRSFVFGDKTVTAETPSPPSGSVAQAGRENLGPIGKGGNAI